MEQTPDDNALFWDVWLSLYPELGLKTLKRIKRRIESGSYELNNVIPEDILRRQLDIYTTNLKDAVKSLDRKSNVVKKTHERVPRPKGSKYVKCHHRKYVQRKPLLCKTTKVSRSTSPFISSEVLEHVLVEELLAKTKPVLPADPKYQTTAAKKTQSPKYNSPNYENCPREPQEDCASDIEPSETVESSETESVVVFCSSSSSSDCSRGGSLLEGSLETVIVQETEGSLEKELHQTKSVWCEDCSSCLIQLKKQALKIWIPVRKSGNKHKECELLNQIEADLHAPEGFLFKNAPPPPSTPPSASRPCDECSVCGTSLSDLKQQTLAMVQTLDRTHQQQQQIQNKPQGMSLSALGIAKGVASPSLQSSRIPTPRAFSDGGSKAGGLRSGRAGHYRSGRQSSPSQPSVQSPRHDKRDITNKASSPHHRGNQQQPPSPADLPPRKDSPFPQAIAAEKLHRDRRQRHQHQSQQPLQTQHLQSHHHHAWTACQGQRSATQTQMLNNNAVVAGRNAPHSKQHPNAAGGTSKTARLLANNTQYYQKMELTPQDYINENGSTGGSRMDYMGSPPQGSGVPPPRPSLLPVQYNNLHHPQNNHHSLTVNHQQQMVANHSHHYHQPNNHPPQNPTSAYMYAQQQHQLQQQAMCAQQSTPVLLSPGGSTSSTGSGTAAAVSFFTRAAQKINLSSKKRKKKEPPEPEPPPFPTNFRHVIGCNPPPIPPGLLRSVPGKLQAQFPAKVKVILRICPVEANQSGNYMRLDARKKQITLHDPTSYSGYAAPSQRSRHVTPSRLFELDSVFSQDDAMPELCSSALVEIIQSVVNGSDGCLFSYGHARLGKTYTMIGVDEGPQNLGIIPCAISWLFRLIETQKERTGARFSVRVSAVEVTGKQEMLKDLLAHVATSADQCSGVSGGGNVGGGRDKAPGLYLREDPICGTQLENQSELWSPTAEKAAYYLDAAIAARTVPEVEDDARNSHLLFTIHVYQYRVEKGTRSGCNADGVAGGRSRLHVLDLGSCSKSSKDGQSLSLNALGMAVLALINGQKHIPHRESKLTQLLRESLGNGGCRTCMIAHVSPALHAYHETLQVVQLAAKIQRTKRRRKLMSGTSSDDSSSCDGESMRHHRRMRTGIRMGTLREMSHSDPDYTSSSEQSCDTVIYVGPHGHALSDQELTDNERPPTSLPLMPRSAPKIQPRTVPTFSRSKSQSGDESSDAASSIVSQTESSKIPKFGEHRSPSGRSTPRSPESRITTPTSMSKPKLGPSPLSYQNGYHNINACPDPTSYGPAPLPGYYHSHSVDESQLSQHRENNSEQWIDGPMMAPCSNGSKSGGAPYQQPSQGHYVDAPVVPKTPVNPSALNEQWIDGPKEFLVGRTPGNIKNDLKEEGKISLLPKSAASPRSSSKRDHRTQKASEKKTELTSTVLQNNEYSKPDTACKPCEHSKSGSKLPVKPFVKDWVEKHSSISSAEVTEDDRSQRSTCSSRSKTKSSGSPLKKASMDDMLYGKEITSKTEHHTHSSPKSGSQVSAKSEGLESNDRMVALVKSVQDSTTNNAGGVSDGLTEHQKHELFEGFDNVIADIDQEINEHNIEDNSNPPPTYDICTKTDSVNQELVPIEEESYDDRGIEFVVEHSENTLDTSVSEGANDDVTNLLMSNRESIYELQFDAELETSRSSIRNSFHSEDDAWSLGSLPKDIQLDNLIDTEDVDNVQVPDCIDNNNELTLHSAKISTLDSGNCTQLDNSFVTVESSRGIHNELDTSTGISTMDSQDNDKNHFDSIVTDKEEVDLIIDASEYNTAIDAEVYLAASSEPQYAVLENTPIRPCSLRKPDGASNPNLSVVCETPKSSSFSSPNEELVYHMGCGGVTNLISPPYLSGGCISYGERSVVGQSPDDPKEKQVTEYKKQKDCSKGTKTQVATKPPVSYNKPSVLPKPNPTNKESPSKSSDKPTLLQRASSKGSQSSLRKDVGQVTPSPSSDSSQKNSFVRSHSAPAKSIVSGAKPKEKSFANCASPVNRPSSVKSSKNSFSSRLPLCSGKRKDTAAQSSPTKSSASSSKDSKSSKESRSSSKESKTSSKDSKSCSTKDSKSNNTSKDSKSSSSLKVRSKSPSPNKRDRERDKECKLPTGRSGLRYNIYHSKGGESDSGIESGQVRSDHRFLPLSPNSNKRSKPRISMHSTSSGHGSDVSSTFSSHHLSGKTAKEARDVCNSSGYESMLRDSEVTGTSSSHDSTSESGHSDLSSSKIPKKRSILSKRSKSAPAYSNCSTPTSSRHSSPCKKPSNGPGATSSQGATSGSSSSHPKGWVDTRTRGLWESDDPLEIKVYEIEDVERMARRRKEELELRAVAKRRLKIRELLEQQEKLKEDFQHSKYLLMVEPVTWSYDLHVAEQMDRDDPDFLEALEKETQILQKRVDACKSRIMLVTCFDNTTSTSTVL